MKSYNKEFYIGLVVWVLGVISGYGMWIADKDVLIDFKPTVENITLIAGLYCLFLIGHLITHEFFEYKKESQKIKIIGVVISGLAVLGLTICLFYAIVALFSTLLVTQLALYMDKKSAYFIAVLVPILGISVDLTLERNFSYPIASYPVVIIYGTFNTLALLAHFHLIDEQRSKIETEHLLRELKATQCLLKASSERNERIRIARELHDSLGHQLTALDLQLEVACHVPNELKDVHLKQAKNISKTLLSNIRETVSDIRQKEDRELVVALRSLTREMPNLDIELAVDMDESCLTSMQNEVIFRSVQEALTNVARHSNADKCVIILNNDQTHICVSIEDNGDKKKQFEPGNGLIGMAERIESVDGNLLYLSNNTGFNIHFKIPITI